MEILMPCRLDNYSHWGLGDSKERFCLCQLGGSKPRALGLEGRKQHWASLWPVASHVHSLKGLLCIQPALGAVQMTAFHLHNLERQLVTAHFADEEVQTISFIHSFNRYLLSTYYVPDRLEPRTLRAYGLMGSLPG